jgi:hypothetical protein
VSIITVPNNILILIAVADSVSLAMRRTTTWTSDGSKLSE